MISAQELLRQNGGMCLLLSHCGRCRNTHTTISPLETQDFFFSTQKGQKLGKVDISCSLSHFFFLFSHFLSHWHYSAKGEMKRVIERGGEFSTRPIEECERVRDGRQKEREGKRRQDEKVNGG